jgi:hypothetical protein
VPVEVQARDGAVRIRVAPGRSQSGEVQHGGRIHPRGLVEAAVARDPGGHVLQAGPDPGATDRVPPQPGLQERCRVGVQDDTTALLLLGMILGIKAQGGVVYPILVTTLKTMAFFATVVGVRWLVRYSTGKIPHSRRFVSWAQKNLRGKEPLFGLTLVFVLSLAAFTEAIGLHFVVGAFFGSMILSRKILGRENYEAVEKTASGVTMAFLAPIFFAGIGVEFQLTALTSAGLLLTVLAAAFLSKVVGGYIGGRLCCLNAPESWVVGFGMNGRGVMELVIADLALKRGFITPDLFSTLVLMGMVTTVLTPVLLKRAFNRAEAQAAAHGEPPLVRAPRPLSGEVSPEFVNDLAGRQEWARNASGTETDAGTPLWRQEKAS